MQAAVIIAGCVASVLFWLMMPMGMYVVCKLFQERREDKAITILLLFCCCGIGHIIAVGELNEHSSRWGAYTIGWLYPMLLYPFGIAFVVQLVLGLIRVSLRGGISPY